MNRINVCFLAVIASLASLPASAYTWSQWNGTNNWSSAANWGSGIPSGVNMGALVKSGIVTIDGTSGAPNLNSVLLGWQGVAALTMTGGSLTVTGNLNDQCLAIGESSAGTFTQSGGTVTAAVVSFNRTTGGNNGVYNLNGGTLAAGLLNKPGAGVNATLNLNGGTLQATAPGVGWLSAGIAVYVQAGGAIIDTQTNDVGFGSALLDGGGGGLTKNGTGALTLTGLNTYTNVTTVNAGTLIYNVAAANPNINAISGAGAIQFQGNQGGFYSLIRTLANAGTTTVSLTTGSQPWFGTIFAQSAGQGGVGLFSTSSVLNVLSGKVDLRSNQTVAGLTGSGGYVTTDAPATPVLTVNPAAGQSYAYSGTVGITADVTYNTSLVSFTKTGAGTQILSGTNTYTGATTVNGGSLLVNGSLAAGSAVAVNAGGMLGGTGTVYGTVTVNASGFLAPGDTNSVGMLTASNLVMVSGASYRWKCNAVTSDLTRVLGTINLPAVAAISFSALGGASVPTQGVLIAYGGANAGATDLSGWTVSTPGMYATFTHDTANKRVLFTLITAVAGADGVWNMAGALTPPTYAWSDTANWTNGVVAGGTNMTAHFDAVDVTNQFISLGGGIRTIGQMIFNDTVPNSGDGWSLTNGALDMRVFSGRPVIAVSNSAVSLESNLTLTGDFTKTGAGTLTLKDFPATSIIIAQGRVAYYGNADSTVFTSQSLSGAGDVAFTGQSAGYYSFRAGGPPYSGTLSYTGHTFVSLTPGSGNWWQGTLWLERDDVLPHATVVDLLSGKIYLRNQTGWGLNVAGLTGNAGTFITTDKPATEMQKWTVSTAAGTSYEFAGKIGDDGTGTGNNNVSLIKNGLGTQILSGTNTFAGALIVSNGTLLVHNAAGSGTGIGNSVTVTSGASLGGTGAVLSASTTLNAGSSLIPGGTNAVGTLTVSNLVMAAGMTYQWECNTVTSDLVRVLGTISLPASATIVLSAVGGATLPAQCVLCTYGVTNSGATDLSGWAVNTPGVVGTFTDDAANRRVLYTVTVETNEADGVWNKAGSLSVPDYAWHNTGNWVSGIVAGGTNRTAHFDQMDSTMQAISLGGGSRTIGYLSFNDTVPVAYGYWDLHTGTLNLCVTSGSPAITVSNTNVDVRVEADLTLSGDFTKAGAGTLTLKTFPSNSINIAEGRVTFDRNADDTRFTIQSISGGGDVEFDGQTNGYFTLRANQYYGTLSYTGHTRINLTLGSAIWWQGALWLEKDDVLPHATVVDLLSGKIYTRAQTANGLTVAGLTGNAGTYITTDQGLQKWTLDVSNGVSCAYAGKIGADGTAFGNSNESLMKKGLGTQILSGANTFVGPLAVSNGTLLVNNATGSGSGISNSVTVAAGATLGGTGTLLSTNVTLDAAATLAPGGTGSVGTLTFGGNLALAAGAICAIDCTNSVSDTVTVGGTLTLPSTATVNMTIVGTPLPRRITLFTAGLLAGETDLRGWQAQAGLRRYLVTCEGTTVVLTIVPAGTLIRLL